MEIGPLALDVEAGCRSWSVGTSGHIETHDHMIPFDRAERVEVLGWGPATVIGNGFAIDKVIVLVDDDDPLHLRQVNVDEVTSTEPAEEPAEEPDA